VEENSVRRWADRRAKENPNVENDVAVVIVYDRVHRLEHSRQTLSSSNWMLPSSSILPTPKKDKKERATN
jgi:hypothetical protein